MGGFAGAVPAQPHATNMNKLARIGARESDRERTPAVTTAVFIGICFLFSGHDRFGAVHAERPRSAMSGSTSPRSSDDFMILGVSLPPASGLGERFSQKNHVA